MIKTIFYFKSKNYTSFKKFLLFLKYLLLKIKTKKKFNSTKIKKFFFSILKSPHVNKKAQEQFVYVKRYKSISMCTNQHKTLLTMIKKLNLRLFTDVQIKIKTSVNKNYKKKMYLNVFNPFNFKLNLYNKLFQEKLIKKIEKNKKNLSLVSSVWLEQRTENPCVGSSNLSLNILFFFKLF